MGTEADICHTMHCHVCLEILSLAVVSYLSSFLSLPVHDKLQLNRYPPTGSGKEPLTYSNQDLLMLRILGMTPYVDGVHQEETPIVCVVVSEDSQSISGGGGKSIVIYTNETHRMWPHFK